MTIEDFVNKAIEGGWEHIDGIPLIRCEIKDLGVPFARLYWKGDQYSENGEEWNDVVLEVILLDPEAWKAVGKVEGWETEVYKCESLDFTVPEWHKRMLNMIDALCEGKSLQDYLKSL